MSDKERSADGYTFSNPDVYPASYKLEKGLDRDNMLDWPLAQIAIEFLGEYEHGSVDLNVLYSGEIKHSWDAMSEEERDATNKEMTEFMSTVLWDFLAYVDANDEGGRPNYRRGGPRMDHFFPPGPREHLGAHDE